MINFNGASEQKEVGNGKGAIPPKSIVKVRMSVRQPSESKKSDVDPMLCKSSTGNSYLDCAFKVVGGTYDDNDVWQTFVVHGSEKATNISMAFLRAVLEASRHINPSDSSPQATQARQLNGWSDFNGMEFPALIDVKPPKAGDIYINNTIKRIITPDKDEYNHVMGGGEIISDLPLPAIPDAPATQNNGGWMADPQPQQAQQSWAAPQPPPPEQAPAGKPAWA